GAALRPVRRMSQEADAISLAQAGRRLPQPEGEDEIAQLGRTLNVMLDRIEAAFARERMFLDDASHELRTPIAVLRAELEVALLDLAGGQAQTGPVDREALERSLRSALEEANRLAHLAEDLLVLARATAGRLPLRRRPVDVRVLAEEAARRGSNGAAGRAGAAGVAVQVDGPAAQAVVDPARLEQVINNLVGNARRFARRRVQVGVRTEGDDVVVTVADDGPGFPAALPLEPRVPGAVRDPARHTGPEIALQGFDVGRAAHRAVTGNDRGGQVGHEAQHLDPGGGVALEGQRRHTEEAHVAGEEDRVV